MITRKQYLLPRLSILLTVWFGCLVGFLVWYDGFPFELDENEIDELAQYMVLVPEDFRTVTDLLHSQEWLLQVKESIPVDLENRVRSRHFLHVWRPDILKRYGFEPGDRILRVRDSRDLLKTFQEGALYLAADGYLYPGQFASSLKRKGVVTDWKLPVVSLFTLLALISHRFMLHGLAVRRSREMNTEA